MLGKLWKNRVSYILNLFQVAKRSGGMTARNPREGFRSEQIARYIFSSFGSAVTVTPEDDIGLDLLCNLSIFHENTMTFKSSYGVQVKSDGYLFEYQGKQATKWLMDMEYPLLLASVSKKEGRVKIYSTQNLNRYILNLHSKDDYAFPESITFVTSEDCATVSNEDLGNGKIHVGKPILDIYVNEIGDLEKRDNYWGVLDGWLEVENKNYRLRRVGISCTLCYTKWETNIPLNKDLGEYFKPYYHSEYHSLNTKETLAEGFIAVACHAKACAQYTFPLSSRDTYKEEFNDIRSFFLKYLRHHHTHNDDSTENFINEFFKEDLV